MDKQPLILIVDDEEGIRKTLGRKLADEGFRCVEVDNAISALEYINSDNVDLAILDIKMPGKSGIDLLPDIEQLSPDTVIIMATAVTDASAAIFCLKQGAYDYINKPFNLEEISLSVKRALEKRRLKQELKFYHEHLKHKVKEQSEKIRISFLNSINSLVYALEAKDVYTSGHSQRVAEISVAIAKKLELAPKFIEQMMLAGQIHDIGKIGIRETVLNKPAQLTAEEYRHVQEHCEIGARILAPVVEANSILDMVKHHHERYDGKGYPDGLTGEQIPFGARIMAVADAYDAMTSGRPYRKAMETETAIKEIERSRGSQFDPSIADIFLSLKKM